MSTLVETQLADENPLVEGLERLPVHPTALVIFGATGDLAHRKLLPALYNLAHEGALPERFELIGVARREKPDDEFREMAKRVDRAVLAPPARSGRARRAAARHALRVGDVRRGQGLRRDRPHPVRVRRARPGFSTTASTTCRPRRSSSRSSPASIGGQRMDACEQADVRLVIEKPFGYDLESARMLNSQLLDVFDESQIYRIDHYLGKETVQNLMALRFANALFEPVWNRNYIDSVEITAAEDIGIGTRAGYYEGAGALRDLVQNHMMQLLSLLAMEPPAAFEANRLRDEKLKVLEAIVPPEVDEVAVDGRPRSVRRGRVRRRARARLPRGAGRGARLAHRDVRGAAPARVATGAGPASRSTCAPASAWRARSPRSWSRSSRCRTWRSGARLGRRAVQPDRAHRAARRGRVGVAGGEDPRRADAHPSGQHGVPLRDGVHVAVARGLRAADPRRDARRRHAVHAQRRDRGAVGDHRPDPEAWHAGHRVADRPVRGRVAGPDGGERSCSRTGSAGGRL